MISFRTLKQFFRKDERSHLTEVRNIMQAKNVDQILQKTNLQDRFCAVSFVQFNEMYFKIYHMLIFVHVLIFPV